ncbi:MAG: Ca-activated chloride channel [Actinomycetota bacterium]|nr:Ca-activated chloride channel [Actinomycetota bacterium]
MTTLNDIIDLAVEVGSAVEAGPLRLFPLFATAPSAPGYLSGPEAAGAIAVEEHDGAAEVPELVLTSGAALPLLLLEGETILGVKQNRTLNVSVLCLPQTPTVIPVSCVEAGRWGAVQPVSRSPRLSPSSLRAAKTRSVVNSVRTRASKRSDQNLVWETVDSYASFLACASPTAAMEDVASATAPEVAALVEGLEPVDGQRGVLVVTAGGVVALDLFDKPSTLAAYWDGLLAGYALDAVDRRDGASATTEFGPADARAFLDHVLGTPATETGAVALGTEVHFGDDDVTGGALVWDGAVVHLAAFGGAAGRRR